MVVSAAPSAQATPAAATPDPAGTGCASLATGATGGAVRTIQALLGTPVDGQFGPATAAAVTKWQQGHQVAVTGVVDAATWASFPPAAAAKACARKAHGAGVTVGCARIASGATGLAVDVLQAALKITVDGQFGLSTATALEQVQDAAGLTATGATSRKTWTVLHLMATPVCTRRIGAPVLPTDWPAQQRVRATVDRLAAELEQVPGTSTNKVALAAMAFAKKQIGKPYAWGGVGPKSYDCSGLQLTAYLHAGITIPRVAADQYSGSGPTVPLNEAQQGDLLFYASDVTNPATVYHVVMYAGSGNVLDSPHTGASVGVRPLWTTDLLPVAVRPVSALTLPARAGSTGWTVSQLQQALNRHGAALTVDGGFGPSTTVAVQAWQSKQKLKATGVVRLSTWLTLG
jgi:cell wall-associated NlpC family hydrolase